MKNIYAVIMAGGSGERFWPRSRKRCPKQLLSIVSKKSMLQETVARLKGFIPSSKIFIVTNKVQAKQVRKQLPALPSKNVIVEPLSKNTAPCIAVAASVIHKKDPKAVMVVLPADHQIKDVRLFLNTIKEAVDLAARKDVLVTLGIKPKSAHTGYGYIEKGETISIGAYKVAKFAEKPNLQTAEEYVKSGKYLWNSGMFIWRAGSILNEIKEYLPELYELCMKYSSDTVYRRAESISIDYGVMEKTKRAVVVESEFDWDDVGSWSALDTHFKKDVYGNIISGGVVYKDVANSTIMTDEHLIAVIGLSDLVVVAEKGAVLICPKDKAEDVKHIVAQLKKDKKYKEYL